MVICRVELEVGRPMERLLQDCRKGFFSFANQVSKDLKIDNMDDVLRKWV